MQAPFFYTWQWRILLSAFIGLAFALLVGEMAFFFLQSTSDYMPRDIELTIPLGTAEQVAAGKQPPDIPTNISFIVGDTLVIHNEDSVDHQLGPVWVPPGATARLTMELGENLSYACTFQPSRYLGLDVRPRVTWETRLQAIILVAPATAALVAIYSFVLWPLKKQPKVVGGQPKVSK